MAAPRKLHQRQKKAYKIYDLSDDSQRKEFGHAIIEDTFALIKIPDAAKSSLSDLFTVFGGIFKSNRDLVCEHNEQYVGHTSSKYIKQSLWFYQNYDSQSLFPKMKDKKSALYHKGNEQKVYQAFTRYNQIADDCLHAILRYHCNDEQSYIKCWNSLFPNNPISTQPANDNDDNEQNDEDSKQQQADKPEAETKHNASSNENENDNENAEDEKQSTEAVKQERKQTYPESAVYSHFRRDIDLSLNNLASIQYFGSKNKKTKKGLFEMMKKSEKDRNANPVMQPRFPCEEHMDYTLVTLIMSNEPGLQVRDIHYFDWINIEEVVRQNGMHRKDVIVCITGLTMGTLMHDRMCCYHSVRNQYAANDRISFPLFCYADPNGFIDTTLIKPNARFKITLRDQRRISCSEYLARNMHPSVNF